MLTIAQLTKVVTEEQALGVILDELEALKFAARSWQSGSIPLTLVHVFARLWANGSSAVADIAAAGFNDLATGGWLDLLSLSHYKNARKSGSATEGYLTLTAASNAPGPFTFAAGDLVFVDKVVGRSYRNVAGDTLPAGQSLDVLVRAEQMGSAGDVPNGTITIMRTPLVGVTVTNAARLGTNSWITQNGSDVESHEALRERNRSKWGSLAIFGGPELAYRYWAATAHQSVRRVHVDTDNPRGSSTLDIYLAGDAGPVSATVASDVDAFLRGEVDGVQRVALGADVLVKSAERLSLRVRAKVYVQTAFNNAGTQALLLQVVSDHFRNLPIGGARFRFGTEGTILLGELFRGLLTVPGVRNVVFESPSSDLTVLPSQVVVPNPMFSFVSV